MKEIITALNAAYKECGYVQKAGKNKEQGYKFAGEADFIEAVRPVLLKHGIVVYPSGYSLIKGEDYLTKSGSRMNRIVAEYRFTFAHISGESIQVVAVGEGADTSDKASPKAATIALKYALRQTLLIETGDDPDVSTPEEGTAARAKAPAAGPTPEEKAMRTKAEAKLAEVREQLAPLDSFAQAAWLQENPDQLKAIQWLKRNYPDLYAEIQGLGVEV
ncbi:ERF family protein [Mesorhizobium sp. ES1-1]|uniref:ERF family protein n=1 Tax=Mesorhizobium sp. ES1-1 TaxID=2876629 RepID=UPI001CCE27FC|nr:ERF family protein [Mesorhizobium sp. ES1-1]MBZ9674535.1 ERF family protein [Mesorhizobium sp. ES1-1]